MRVLVTGSSGCLAAALGRDGWDAAGFQVDGDMGLRVVFR